ncbi:hypothetical protein [Paenibacillus sanfengchensis]|uniref:hypothetical protein n=1 Tax=Paenibacillus sanfengchensis TaxID=3119819 RepID=UPI002FE25D5B
MGTPTTTSFRNCIDTVLNPGSTPAFISNLKLPQTVNLDPLIKRLSARQVKAVTEKSFYLTNWLEREKFLRISIPRVRPERIEEGVRGIMEEVRRENKKSPSDS